MKPTCIAIGVVLMCAVNAVAQPRELKSSQGRTVFVIDADRREWQGRLLKISTDALELEGDAGVRTFDLRDIRRVDADGDGIWDGALKGAAIGAGMGLIPLAFGANGWAIPSNAFWAGLLGLAIDGGCSSRHPVFYGPALPRVPRAEADTGALVRVGVRVRW